MFKSKQTIREETDEIKAFTLQSYEAFVSGFIRFREIDLKSPGKTSQEWKLCDLCSIRRQNSVMLL